MVNPVRVLLASACLALLALPAQAAGLLVRQGDGSYAAGDVSRLPASVSEQPCLKYNNYWCLKGIGWDGKTGTGEQNLIIFSSPVYAARAVAMTLRTYELKHGLKTPRAMMSRFILSPGCLSGGRSAAGCAGSWALVDKYARQIGTALGIGPDDPVRAFHSREEADGERLRTLIRTIAHIEIGVSVQVADALINDGIALAGLALR